MNTFKNTISEHSIYKPMDIRHVRVGGWIGQRMELTWRNNLLALNWDDDFLRPFIEKKGNGGEYVGLGKTLDGLARFAAYTSEPRLLALRQRVVETLLASQEEDGYLGMYQKEKRIKYLWDVHEQAYILFALVSNGLYFHEEPSLVAARKLGDYLVSALSAISLETIANGEFCLELSMLGLDRALMALYRKTQDHRYLDFCAQKLRLADWDLPIVEGRHGRIEGHAYAYFTRCLAQLDLYEISGDARLLKQTHRALEFLRNKRGLVITGTCSQSECWHSDQMGAGDLGETCATAYWIRLCGRLLCLEGSGKYGDLMERAIYNALFAAQSPDGRRLRYYTPFEGKRVYFEKDTYCCPGNFRRIMSELPELIYLTGASGFIVNLYTPSRATISLDSGITVNVIQETDYPNSGRIVLGISPSRSARFAVRLRIPSWCQKFTATVNGCAVPTPVQQGLLLLDREWKSDDKIELIMEMPWRLVRGLVRQEGKAAILRGPVLFCLNPSRNHLDGHDFHACVSAPDAIEPPVPDETLRPKGLSCRLKHKPPDGQVLLTEFADPDGEVTYFKTTNDHSATHDELLKP